MRIRCPWLVVALFLAVLAVRRPAQAFVRHPVDDRELLDVRAASKAAADAYVQAEARLRAGDLLSAKQLLATARELSPSSFLLARRECQVLTELGERAAAIAACTVALSGVTAMDERAYVGALMSGVELVKPKELAEAMREAANARRLHGQPFGDVALCEIAHHLGDDAMFSACLTKLRTNAAGYFETARWRAARPGPPSWLYWAGWSLLAALGGLTLLRGLVRWFRHSAPHARRAGTAVALALGLQAVALPARVAAAPEPDRQPHYQLSHFAIDFEDPENHIPTVAERNQDPLEFGYFLQDLSAEALKAERNSDFRKAIKFWRASVKAVPDEAVGFSRACRVYQILGERELAIEFCARALNLHGVTPEDYLRFSELIVGSPNALSEVEVQDLDAAVKHLGAQPNGAGPAAVIECQLGVKLEDEARLAHCTSALVKTTPNDPHTLTFQWALAMKRRDYSEARRQLSALAKTAMTASALSELRAATEQAAVWWRRPLSDPRYGFGLLALLALGGLFVLRLRGPARQPRTSAASAG